MYFHKNIHVLNKLCYTIYFHESTFIFNPCLNTEPKSLT